jgi:hypothetical protein
VLGADTTRHGAGFAGYVPAVHGIAAVSLLCLLPQQLTRLYLGLACTACLGVCAAGRLYLSPYDLTPTYRDIHNKFSVRYFLNLVLVDEEDRRYFKQQEILLYRKADDGTQQQQTAPPSLGSS